MTINCNKTQTQTKQTQMVESCAPRGWGEDDTANDDVSSMKSWGDDDTANNDVDS